jgi:hypothetical protein
MPAARVIGRHTHPGRRGRAAGLVLVAILLAAGSSCRGPVEQSLPPVTLSEGRAHAPGEYEAAIRAGAAVDRIFAESDEAVLRGDFAEAERLLLTLDPPAHAYRHLVFLYIDAGRWRDAEQAAVKARGDACRSLKWVPMLARYKLGDREGGDRRAPAEAEDCGVYSTYDDKTHASDERPNKPVLDSPRKREAAAWHALALPFLNGLTDLERKREVEYSERAARMFPDEPAFSLVYARALRNTGYTTGAVEWFERTLRNGRGRFRVGVEHGELREARLFLDHPKNLGRRP